MMISSVLRMNLLLTNEMLLTNVNVLPAQALPSVLSLKFQLPNLSTAVLERYDFFLVIFIHSMRHKRRRLSTVNSFSKRK